MNRFIAIFTCLIFLNILGCGNNQNNHKDVEGIYMDMEGMVSVKTTSGVVVHVPEALLEESGFNEMMTEINVSVGPFQMFFGAEGKDDFVNKIRAIHFHNMTDHDEDLRATYVGDGVIRACYHKVTPHLFCLSEALGDLARDQCPGFAEWRYENAEIISRSFLDSLYGGAVID